MTNKNFDSVLIFSSDALENVVAAGGSGTWKLNVERARQATWLILARKHQGRGEGHREAFMVGRIARIAPVLAGGDTSRHVVEIESYSPVKVPDAWRKGDQYPIKYVNAKDVLGFDPEQLDFSSITERTRQFSYDSPAETKATNPTDGISVAEAKRRLAAQFGVSEGSIEIVIRA